MLIVALQHVYIMYIEIFGWSGFIRRLRPRATDEFVRQTKSLGLNQGLYNGFLAAGLIWALMTNNPALQQWLPIFFLSCVFIAGVVGGLTASRIIFFIQGIPAAVALAAHLLCQ